MNTYGKVATLIKKAIGPKPGVDQTFMMAAYQACPGFVSAADPKFKFTVELIDGEFPQYKIVRA